MSTLQCPSCGTSYHTAASGSHLAIVALTFRCQLCSSDEPLRIVTASTAATAGTRRAAREEPGVRSTRTRLTPAE
jgi:hypothetical protein